MSALKLAAGFLGLSGVLHIVAVVAAGFASVSLPLLPFGGVALLLAWYLFRGGSRFVAWVTFLVLIVIATVPLSRTGGSYPVPDAILYLIALADWASALCLFVVLWKPPGANEDAA